MLIEFGTYLKMYVEVTGYLLEAETSQRSPKYLHGQLLTILISQDETIVSINEHVHDYYSVYLFFY